jgi:hypothetical protein
MKTIILFLLLSTRMLGQWAPDSMPINQQIVGYVNYTLGHRVGDGMCMTLITSALGLTDSVERSDSIVILPMVQIDSSKMIPGDIVAYTNVVTDKGDTVDGHIGVVFFVCKNFYLLASQNTYDDLSHSVVVITHPMEAGEDGVRSVTSTFYRAKRIFGTIE